MSAPDAQKSALILAADLTISSVQPAVTYVESFSEIWYGLSGVR
jgi:hypothetical protein